MHTLKLLKIQRTIRGTAMPSRAIRVAATSVRRGDWWWQGAPFQERGRNADNGTARTRKGMEVGI